MFFEGYLMLVALFICVYWKKRKDGAFVIVVVAVVVLKRPNFVSKDLFFCYEREVF